MNDANTAAEVSTPALARGRETTVDVVRGFALLGILAMNIIAFAYPGNSYENPTAPGSEPYIGTFEGANRAAWWITHVAVDLKMMALFSMLFGGGVVLMSHGRSGGFAGLYYRRLAFLGAVGFVHAFAIWFGDILLSYAIAGLLLYPLRNFSPRVLIPAGMGVLMFGIALAVGMGKLMEFMPEEQRAAMEPTAEKYVQVIDQVRSGAVGSLIYNATTALSAQIFGLVLWTYWRALGLMLIGMGLMKTGFFTGRWSTRAYAVTAAVGYACGLVLIIPIGMMIERDGHGSMTFFTPRAQANYVGSVGVALGHASLLILIVKAGALRFVTDRLAAVGRMAFTNYLATSVVMTFCFYGWGLGLFAKFERAEVYWFVLGMWTLILIWSPLWLAWFRMGPLEWLWRSATHLAWQPMRR
jgi:uncharacterized protein